MRKLVALPILSSDLLSSVAYGPEAMLTVLVLAGSGALGLSLPLAALLVVLMVAVGLSYRQTIPAYPHGAGSYIVAGDNLGATAGLAAAAGLMLDYVLTVSVSVAAGVHAVTSALPGLTPVTVPLGVLVIAVLLAGNLRGVRTAGNIFVLPTYAFVVAVLALLVVGYLRAAGRGFAPVPPPAVPAAEGLGLLLVLRAFASGAVSMTGIEAVSNAVPAFRPDRVAQRPHHSGLDGRHAGGPLRRAGPADPPGRPGAPAAARRCSPSSAGSPSPPAPGTPCSRPPPR